MTDTPKAVPIDPKVAVVADPVTPEIVAAVAETKPAAAPVVDNN